MARECGSVEREKERERERKPREKFYNSLCAPYASVDVDILGTLAHTMYSSDTQTIGNN